MAASPSTDQRTSPVSPWATPNTKAAEPCSLAAVMDEEYAEQLMRQDFGEDFSTAVIQERNANQSLEQKNEDTAIKSDGRCSIAFLCIMLFSSCLLFDS